MHKQHPKTHTSKYKKIKPKLRQNAEDLKLRSWVATRRIVEAEVTSTPCLTLPATTSPPQHYLNLVIFLDENIVSLSYLNL